ncbi:hypothetical protein [Spongiimicrobium salis]|uniref:hypothetical protein n=1 Tax=Spongiimicrobium salis TaxID=1667022 RepID=UPI00374D4CB3
MKYILTLLLVCFLGTLPLQAQMDAADKRELKKAVKLVEKEIKKETKKAKREAKREKRKAKKAKAAAKREKAIKSQKKAIQKDKRKMASLKRKLEKGQENGSLSPVEITKINAKIDKLSESIARHQRRLSKL